MTDAYKFYKDKIKDLPDVAKLFYLKAKEKKLASIAIKSLTKSNESICRQTINARIACTCILQELNNV